MKASSAVTVTLVAVPATRDAGALTVRWDAAAAATEIAPDVPVIAAVTASATVIVSVPEVLSVAMKEPAPPTSVALAGNSAWLSLDVK